MVDIIYKKGIIDVRHVWFCEKLLKSRNSMIFYHGIQNIEPFKNKKIIVEPQHSLIMDLTAEREEIYSNIRKKIRYEIRRCQKENITFRYYTSKQMQGKDKLLHTFQRTYEEMYQAKGMNIKFNLKQVEAYINDNSIEFTIAFHEETPLVFHSYISDENNVRFYYSASPFRTEGMDANLIASMNKGLHWFDIETFKNQGKKEYDWGGISNPDAPNGIDNFKIGFGGKQVTYFNVIYLQGLLGGLYYFLKGRRK